MLTEEQKKEIESHFWWHQIVLDETGYTTPGVCPHGNKEDFESRFGLPKDMTGLSVLDVGTWDGLFAFEAERRGAKYIRAIDIYQTFKGPADNTWQANKPFRLARDLLYSCVDFEFETLEMTRHKTYDYIFYFGVMYHIKDPLGAVEKLISLLAPGGTVLVETTISTKTNLPVLEYKPGWEDDPTNQFYPTVEWVDLAFKTHGAKSVECFYNDGTRATFRIKA